MTLRQLYIKWLVWRGKAIDIWSKSAYPADVLSNLHNNEFIYDDIECGSMEGFLQSLKYKDINKQREICAMTGKDAKNMTIADWQTNQIVWWKGKGINRQGEEFQVLIKSAYNALFEQNNHFRNALMHSIGKKLYHCRGERDSRKTILTEKEFCGALNELRGQHFKSK